VIAVADRMPDESPARAARSWTQSASGGKLLAKADRCHRCGKRQGYIFAFKGFGLRQRGHEARCAAREDRRLRLAEESAGLAAHRRAAPPRDASPCPGPSGESGSAKRTSASTTTVSEFNSLQSTATPTTPCASKDSHMDELRGRIRAALDEAMRCKSLRAELDKYVAATEAQADHPGQAALVAAVPPIQERAAEAEALSILPKPEASQQAEGPGQVAPVAAEQPPQTGVAEAQPPAAAEVMELAEVPPIEESVRQVSGGRSEELRCRIRTALEEAFRSKSLAAALAKQVVTEEFEAAGHSTRPETESLRVRIRVALGEGFASQSLAKAVASRSPPMLECTST